MKSKFGITQALLVLTGTLASGSLSASTLVDSTVYNGHTYQLWEARSIRWADAQTEAVSKGGYLAVLTDAAETLAIYGDFIGEGFFSANDGQQYQAWLGGYTADKSGSTTDPLNWAWVTGESWTAFDAGNFASGEPNGDSEGLTINRFGTPFWNDEGGFVGGYILEKNNVPEAGSSLALLGGAFVLLGTFRRYAAK